MEAISSPARIDVGGLTFNQIDDNDVEWVFDSIKGWHDGPSITVDQVQRVVSHGQFPQEGHRGGRTITISGWIYSETRALVSAAVDSLTALLADGSFDTFTFIDEDAGVRTAEVQLLATPDIAWDTDKLTARFQLQLLTADAYRYGATTSDSTQFAADPVGIGMVFDAFPDGVADFGDISAGSLGVASVRNNGTAIARPVFTVAGPSPADGFTITEVGTGNTITYLGVVPDGSQLVIDSRDASAVIDGVADRSGDVVLTGYWPTIDPAGERDYLFQPISGTSTATLTVECVSTYW